MLKQCVVGLFTVFFGLLSFNSSSQVLWGKAERGMTVEEVSSSYKDAKSTSRAPAGPMGERLTERLFLEGLRVADRDFVARFYFSNDGLSQVSLVLNEDVNKSTSNQIYDSVLEAMRSKYGEEVSAENQGGAMLVRSYMWMNGRVNITATLLAFDDGMKSKPSIQIAYQTRVAESADNL